MSRTEPATDNERAYFGMRYLASKEIASIRGCLDVGCTAAELKRTVSLKLLRGIAKRFYCGAMITAETLSAELHKAIDYMVENQKAGKVKWLRGFDLDCPGSWDWSDDEPFYR